MADVTSSVRVMIVDDDREHVGRTSVGAEEDEIVDFAVLDRDPALDLVLDHCFAVLWSLQPDHEGLTVGTV